MSIKELNLQLVIMGRGLLNKIRFGVDYRYDSFCFMRDRFQKSQKVASLLPAKTKIKK